MTRSERIIFKTIFHLGRKGIRGEWPPMPLQKLMENQAPPRFTDMIKKWSEKRIWLKLTNDTQGVSLTPLGTKRH